MLKLAFTTALAASSLLASSNAQLSTSQLQTVFGAATDLQGDSVTLPQFTLSVVSNSTHALLSMNSTTAPSRVGWMSVGSGTSMANADYLVAWPNQDGFSGAAASPWTLSHRRPIPGDGQGQPIATTGSTVNYYTFLPELSSTSSSPFTVVTFIRPLIALGPPSSTPRPQYHLEAQTRPLRAHATTSLDLSTPISLAATGGNGGASTTPVVGSGSTGGSAGSAGGRSRRDMFLIAHAVCACLALLIFAPAAVLIARFLRGTTWYPAHAALNGLAAVLVIVAFSLGVYISGEPTFPDSHHKMGLSVFIIVLVQVALGLFAHSRPMVPSPTGRIPTLSTKKSPFRLVHIVLGLAFLGLGWATIHKGFGEWRQTSTAQTDVPQAVKIVFYILIGGTTAAYIAGFGLEAMGRNRQVVRTDDGRQHVEKF